MKVWAYYAHPSKVFLENDDIKFAASQYGSDTKVLYAMTPVKKYAKEFKRVRNMDIFHETILDLTEEEWDIMLSNNRDCYLESKSITTRKSVGDKSYPDEVAKVTMLLTFMESVDIDDNADIESITINGCADSMSPVGVLCVPLLKALFKLHYWDSLRLALSADYTVSTDLCPWVDIDEKLLEIVDEMHRSAEIDQLEYFIQNYGHTLAIK